MSDYTPTTEEVRTRFLFNRDRFCDEHTQSEWLCMDSHIQDWESWLAEVKAQAWKEGFSDCLAFMSLDNPDFERASKHYDRVTK